MIRDDKDMYCVLFLLLLHGNELFFPSQPMRQKRIFLLPIMFVFLGSLFATFYLFQTYVSVKLEAGLQDV